MNKLTIQLSVLAAMLLGPVAFADSASPACTGTEVATAVRGTYTHGNMQIEIGANKVSADDLSFSAWTCERNGILIFVAKFDEESFESRAISMSGQYMLDFGEVEGDIINPFDPDSSVPLSEEGLKLLMKADLVEIFKKASN